ncbi:MAG: hypothetical protein J6B85_07405 [Lachnospiraceae bacterium]|nr:hypothetical protein [Lachnospiraceae bacterium]
MIYDRIRRQLSDFYFGSLPGMAERMRERVFRTMDEYDAAHEGESAYCLKAKLYETIAGMIQPVMFEDIPFYFETGVLVAHSDGRYNRGGNHANGWLYLRNEHLFRDIDPYAYEVYRKNRGSLYSQTGTYVDIMHMGLPMRKLFRVGLKGICEEILTARKDHVTQEEKEFLACALAGIQALHTMQMKFARAAEEKGMCELSQIAGRIPWEAPQTLHEGLCAMAFLRKALGAIEGVGFNSFGRVDQLLGPLYERDLEKGVREEDMLDLVSRFLLIWDCTLDRNKKLETGYEYELENTLTLGGCDENGEQVFNGVTRLFLAAREKLDILYPKMMLRYGSDSPEEYLSMISEPLVNGKSFSLYENDDAIIPALIQAGVERCDAVNYVVGGCWDVLTPDVSIKFSGEYLNILKPLEWAIHNKTQLMQENELYFEPLENLESFEELYTRYVGYVRRLLVRKAAPMSRGSREWHKVNPTCALSALMETCIPKRRDITEDGGKYNRECVYFSGFSEVVDSLLAIKKFCFEEKRCTIAELFEACRQNWPDEVLRERAVHLCSYGDGSEESSRLAGRLFDDLYEISRDLPTAYGGAFRIGFNQYVEIIQWGKTTAATPNGRKDGDYICQGLTPSRLQKAVSAADILSSLRYMDMKKCAGNASLTITLPAGRLNKELMVVLFRAVAKSGIQGLQPNCINREELLKAQADPEHYQHLIVRVCGFSAPFVLLPPAYQEEILTRSLAAV